MQFILFSVFQMALAFVFVVISSVVNKNTANLKYLRYAWVPVIGILDVSGALSSIWDKYNDRSLA